MLNKKIGFIGLGNMGFPMAKRLINDGYQVHITNHSDNKISRDKIDVLSSLGGKVEKTIIDVVKNVEIIISILPADDEVREVFISHKMLEAIQKETIIVDMTSCSANAIIDVGKYYHKKGVQVIDAPVSGGIKGAQDGTLTIFGAGDKDTFYKVIDVLNCLGTNTYYIGSIGKGKILKSINNMMSSINTIGVIEGLTIAKKYEIDLGIMQEVIMHSSGNSNSLEKKFDKIINNDYEPNFKMQLMRKDVKIALDSVENDTLPLAQLVYKMFLKCKEYDQLDFTSISQLYNKDKNNCSD